MGVAIHEAGIDVVLAVIQHLRVRGSELFRFLRAADIGEHAVPDQGRPCGRPLGVHGDDVAENQRLVHM